MNRRFRQMMVTLTGAGAAAFDPASLTWTLTLVSDEGTFEDAAKTTPAADDTDVIGAWADQSGNGFDFTQATADNKPILKLNIVNGKPVIRFDGTNDFLGRTIGPLDLVDVNQCTIYLVMMQVGTQTQNTAFAGKWSTTANWLNAYITHTNTLYFDYGSLGGGGSRISGAQLAGWDDAFHVVELYRNGSAGEIRVDGAVVVAAEFIDDLDAAADADFRFGIQPDDTIPMKGDFAQIRFTNVALSSANRSNMHTYLGDLYGITTNFT